MIEIRRKGCLKYGQPQTSSAHHSVIMMKGRL